MKQLNWLEPALLSVRARFFGEHGALNGIGLVVVLALAVVLVGCSAPPKHKPAQTVQHTVPSKTGAVTSQVPLPNAPQPGWVAVPQGGGYYLDDGPAAFKPENLQDMPSATPMVEPIVVAKTRPYEALGQTFVPQTSLEEPFRQKGRASWYGRKFHGQKTANGEVYDMHQMTAAHPTLPLPSYAKVTNIGNGRSVIVRVNDRGPFLRSRVIDLSYAAAYKLGYIKQGSTEVLVEKLTPGDIAAFQAGRIGPNDPLPSQQVLSGRGASSSEVVQTVAFNSPSKPVGAAAQAVRGGVYIQVGVFSNRQGAQTLLDEVASKALTPKPDGLTSTGGQVLSDSGLHRAMLGPFVSLDVAHEVVTLLQLRMNLRGIVKTDLLLP